MKTLVSLLIFILLGITLIAQTPQAFKYQAVARDLSGNVLVSKNVSFRISILQGSAAGTSVYSEKHTKTTNTFGLVDLEIGNGSSPTGSFSTIDWAGNTYFLKVEMDPNGGSSYQLMGTSQLLSVPYAIQSKKAEEVADNSVTAAKIANNAVTVAKLPTGATASTFLRGDGTWQTPSGGTASTPGGDQGSIQYNHRSIFTGDNNLYWDYVNKRMGIGTNAPTASLQIKAAGSAANPHLLLYENTNLGSAILRFQTALSNNYWLISGPTSGPGDLAFFHNTNEIMSLNYLGNAGIGAAPFANFRLRVTQDNEGNYGGISTTNSGTGAAIYANNTSTSRLAGYFNGHVKIMGDDSEIQHQQTGSANMIPICYGVVSATGAKQTGSSTENFTVIRVSTGVYDITISGETYTVAGYVTIATLHSYGDIIATAQDGKLRIRITDRSSVVDDLAFNFVVYKP